MTYAEYKNQNLEDFMDVLSTLISLISGAAGGNVAGAAAPDKGWEL